MAVCTMCGKEIGFFSLNRIDKQTGRCGKCQQELQETMNGFRQRFLNYCRDERLEPSEWERLQDYARDNQISWSDALSYVRGDAIHFLERTLMFAASDGAIDSQEERYFHQLQEALKIPDYQILELKQRLEYLLRLTEIRAGKLPIVRSRAHLDSNEICYLETSARYHKLNAKSITTLEGDLQATSKKLRFFSLKGGMEIDWKKVMTVAFDNRGVYLELTVKSGTGLYQVAQPEFVATILDTQAKIFKRQLVVGGQMSRQIPQDVKVAVWQRDQGKCVQCGATDYLEFDHVIPFSLGGASSLENLQILCRRCNLAKRDKL